MSKKSYFTITTYFADEMFDWQEAARGTWNSLYSSQEDALKAVIEATNEEFSDTGELPEGGLVEGHFEKVKSGITTFQVAYFCGFTDEVFVVSEVTLPD